MHGKPSLIRHRNLGIFEGLPEEFRVGRYHSLYAIPEKLPACLEITAQSEDGVLAQPVELHQRAEQDKEKCANQKSQLAMKRQHLSVMLRVHAAMFLLDGRLGKPVDTL